MNGFRFSVVASVLSDDLRVAAERARRAGFAGVVLDANGAPSGGAGVDLTTLSQSGQRELHRVFESQDVPILALQFELSGRGLSASEHADRALGGALAAMEVAAGLRVPMVCVDLGLLPAIASPAPERPSMSGGLAGLILLPTAEETKQFAEAAAAHDIPAPPADAAFVSRVGGFMDELARAADRTGVRIAFGSTLSSTRSLAGAVGSVDTPLFAFDLDPAAAIIGGASLDATFDLVGDRIAHVRGRDAVVGEGHRSKPAIVGRGDVKWKALIELLREADYTGAITLSPVDLIDPAAAALEGLATLQESW